MSMTLCKRRRCLRPALRQPDLKAKSLQRGQLCLLCICKTLRGLHKWKLHSAAALYAARHSLCEVHVPHALLKSCAAYAALFPDGGHKLLLNLQATTLV